MGTIQQALMACAAGGGGQPPKWDSGASLGSPFVLSDSDRRYSLPSPNSAVTGGARATRAIGTSEKVYWEIHLANVVDGGGTTNGAGVRKSPASMTVGITLTSSIGSGEYGLWVSGRLYQSGSYTTPIATFADGDTMQFAVDIPAGKGWIGKNNSWVGDPAAGTGNSLTLDNAASYYPVCQPWTGDCDMDLRGYGTAIYSPPAGFSLYME